MLNIIEKAVAVSAEDEVFAKPQPLVSISMGTNSKFEEDMTDNSKILDQYMMQNHESTRISQFNGHDHQLTKNKKPAENFTLTGIS